MPTKLSRFLAILVLGAAMGPVDAAGQRALPFAMDQHGDLIQAGAELNARLIVYANLKVFLEGPYVAGGSMTTTLNPADLPLDQPYDNAEFTGTPLEFTPSPDITVPDWTGDRATVVDWVLVDVRLTSDVGAPTVAQNVGLLMSDGSIKEVGAPTTPIALGGIPEGFYFVIVRHRNHPSIMSSVMVELSSVDTSAPLYDFTTAQAQAFGASPMTEVETGVFAMYAGDADANQQIQTTDKNDVWTPEVGLAGYRASDFDMNGQVQTTDKNDYWTINVGVGSQVPD